MEELFWSLVALTTAIHLVDTLSYAVRLSAVRSGQYALTMSMFNMFSLVARTANTFQIPWLGSLIGLSIVQQVSPLDKLHWLTLAASGGTLLGIVLIPTFLKVFDIGISRLETAGSLPSLVVEALHLGNIRRVLKQAAPLQRKMAPKLRYRDIPKRLLVINTVVTAVYTVGILSAYYASTMVPVEQQLAAAGSSGWINGVASILLTLFVDPRAAVVTDQALRGQRPYGDVKMLVVLLIGSKLLGTFLGHLVLTPAAWLIAAYYRW